MRIHGLHLAVATAVLAAGAWAATAALAQDEVGGVDKDKMAFTDLIGEYQDALQKKRWESFREKGTAFCKKYPKHFGGHWHMAQSYVNEGNPSAALPWFEKASNIDPAHFMAAFETGVTHLRYKEGDKTATKKAAPFLERALEARKKETGLHQDETAQKMMDFVLGPALCDIYWDLGEQEKNAKKQDEYKEKVRTIAERELGKQPLSSVPCWYLGVMAEEGDNRAKAIELYKKGASVKLESPFNGVFHRFGVEDKRMECSRRARFLDSTTVRYGEIKNDGLTFVDSEKSVEVMLPHPKMLKLKKGQRSPWVYMFPPHEAKAGSVITHVSSAVCQSNSVGGAFEVEFIVSGGAHTLNLNSRHGGGSYKLVEPGKTAEGLFNDNTHRNAAADLKNVKKPQKGAWGRGYKGYVFSYTCKDKELVDNYKKEPKKWRKPVDWDHHWYVVKAKKLTFWVQIRSREGFWKKRQKEIQFMLKQLKLP